MDADLEHLLLIYALQNAVKHDAAPKSGTVIGTVLGKHPEYRSRARELGPLAGKAIAEVAAMTPAERKNRLEAIAPELLAELLALLFVPPEVLPVDPVRDEGHRDVGDELHGLPVTGVRYRDDVVELPVDLGVDRVDPSGERDVPLV